MHRSLLSQQIFNNFWFERSGLLLFSHEMGSLGGGENGNHINSRKNDIDKCLSNVETQQVDSGDLRFDGAEDFHYPSSTLPVDDTFLSEDVFETQLVDLVGETQLVDHPEETQSCYQAGETQLTDLAWETQVLDDFDCVNHALTQSPDQSVTMTKLIKPRTGVIPSNYLQIP